MSTNIRSERKIGSDEGVKYDSKEYKASVEVKDNGKGKVVTEITVKRGLFKQDEISFTNKYTDHNSVKTGDNSNMLPFAMFAVISLMGAAHLLTRRKTEDE